ncbi:hypothetical protein K474DRAFT_1578538, partial [Panus rudis PR-1116 ss-1]
WAPDSYRGLQSLHFSNRYFTLPRYAEGEEPIPFSAEIDPKGILETIAKEKGYLHLEDNAVSFYEKVPGKNGKRQVYIYIQKKYIFNYVHTQVSFLAIPLSGQRYKMVCKLYSICVLSRLVEKVCQNTA